MDNKKTAPSLYIHIPFCRKKCLYCDFYSIPHDADLARAYIDVIVRQVDSSRDLFSTIYIGGGTPTVLDGDLLEKLLRTIAAHRMPDGEISIEANPEGLTKEKVSLMREHGINRISIGIQSLRDDKLAALGRVHDRAAALTAIEDARRAGFTNIGIDLIFGIWDEREDDWQRELDEAVRLPVAHLSPYALSYEALTPLSSLCARHMIRPLSDETVAALYDRTRTYLESNGFLQYEISNFARPGYACAHNMRYWENESYVGLGPSAVSYIGAVRSRNVANVEHYIRRYLYNKSPVIFSEHLSDEARARETAALKIRTKEGIDFGWFKEKTGFDLAALLGSEIGRLTADGLIAYSNENNAALAIALTSTGLRHCDTVSSAFV